MGTMLPEELSANKEAFHQLAEQLRTETFAVPIVQHLKALNEALADQSRTQEGAALAFLEAKGLATLLGLLKGTAREHTETDAGNTIHTISESAGKALISLLTCTAEDHKPISQKRRPAMISALEDAPHPTARVAAARALVAHVKRKEARKATAEAGVIKLVLAFFRDEEASTWSEVGPVWDLARMLLRWEIAAWQDLKRVIGAQDADLAFIALIIVKDSVREHKADVLDAIKDCGLANTLVITLKQKSHCCAAAAAALGVIGQTRGGHELLVASRAIPCLVSVIKEDRPAADPKKMKRFSSGDHFKFLLDFRPEGIPFSNPTAAAVAVLAGVNHNEPLLRSFLASKGVGAVVQLLEKSTCPAVTDISETLIARMLDERAYPPEGLPLPLAELAEKFFNAGLWKVAGQALKRRIKGTDRSLLYMLAMFIWTLPTEFQREAMTHLGPGDLVEVTMAHMAEAGADELVSVLRLFQACWLFPEGRQRMCAPGRVDQLMQWIARWLSEAPWAELLALPMFLSDHMQLDACWVSAAINANVIPGLVRCLNGARDDVDLDPDHVAYNCSGLEATLNCFDKLMGHELPETRQLYQLAIDAGLVSALIGLLTLDDELTVSKVLVQSEILVLSAPIDQLSQWVGLVRAMVKVLTARAGAGANPPIAARAAAETLCSIGYLLPELFADVQTWGLEDCLQQLRMHSDLDLAAAARQLQERHFGAKQVPPCRRRSSNGKAPPPVHHHTLPRIVGPGLCFPAIKVSRSHSPALLLVEPPS